MQSLVKHKQESGLTVIEPSQNSLLVSLRQEGIRSIIRIGSSITISEAMSQPNQISSLRRDHLKELKFVISSMIQDLLSSVNFSNNQIKMTAEQILGCTDLIISEFWQLRPEEILYVFKNAKVGKYGKKFNHIDAGIICEWIRTYNSTERLDEIKIGQEKKKSEHSKEELASIDIYARLREEANNPNRVLKNKIKDENSDLKKEAEFQIYKHQYLEDRKNNPIEDDIF